MSRSDPTARAGVRDHRFARWRHRWYQRRKITLFEWAVILLAVLYFAWAVWGTLVARGILPDSWLWEVDVCGGPSDECAALLNVGKGALVAATALTVFLMWRLRMAKRPVRRRARAEAREYVPTAANSILDEVVGRDQLCLTISDELRVREARRPHLLVGGVGSGKTAVMVRLTELLARAGAVPVPIRLRSVGDDTDLDFAELARRRFCQVVNDNLLLRGFTATAIGEQAWRWLRKEDRVVVLADGLEEVFAGKPREQDRDNMIRRAVRKAGDDQLPLVIASRPHAPLRDVEAVLIELEPLSEEAALGYIEGDDWSEDEARLDWIVERAEVAGAPLYLQVASQLYHADRLQHVFERRDEGALDTRATDRDGLRFRLLEAWVQALCDGHLRGDLALTRQEREEAVEWISALACLGLLHDTIEVRFDHLVDGEDACAGNLLKLLRTRLGTIAERWEPTATATVRRRTGQPHHVGDGDHRPTGDDRRRIQLAAAWGEQLQLVEAHGDRVRFQHSLMQAYLGSRCLGHALAGQDWRFLESALEPAAQGPGGGDGTAPTGDGPGRELLISLVFLSRHLDPGGRPFRHDGPQTDDVLHRVVDELFQATGRFALGGGDDPAREQLISLAVLSRHLDPRDRPPRHDGPQTDDVLHHVVNVLLDAADGRSDEKALDLYACALEIDRALGWARHGEVMQHLTAQWCRFTTQDPRAMADAKRNLVRRLGDTLRQMVGEGEDTPRAPAPPAGGTLHRRAHLDPEELAEDIYRQFFDLGCYDPDYAVRLAVAEEIGRGGTVAFDALRRTVWHSDRERIPGTARLERSPGRFRHGVPGPSIGTGRHEHPDWRQHQPAWDEHWTVMKGWLAPLLVGSVRDPATRDEAKNVLRRYVDEARGDSRSEADGGPGLVLEIALAQGFKAAANRRIRHPDTCPESKSILLEQAEDLLTGASYWYTHLTLVHAFTLWNLRDDLPSATADRASEGKAGRKPSPRLQVDHWLSLAGRDAVVVGPGGVPPRRPGDWSAAGRWRAWRARQRLHPFVREAGHLAVRALERQHPERYLWIDETGVVDQIGSLPSDPHQRRVHNLWIPPSTGWTALDRRAQQLVADVRLLLDLTYRGDPRDHARYLQRADRPDLPFCLTGDRRHLQPWLSVAKPGRSDPGLSCAGGCPFELCPYPPRGTVRRKDMAEAFCRRQLTLLHHRRWWPLRRSAPWQRPRITQVVLQKRYRWGDLRMRNLRRFWVEMADRRTVHRPGTHRP